MGKLLETVCPCGHKLQALAVGIEGGNVQEIIDIIPKKCLHAFIDLGEKIR